MLAIFLDIEATGLDANRHHAIDLAFKLIDVSSGQEKGSYQSLVRISSEEWSLRDPASIEINGYTWEEIAQGKERAVIREEVIALFKGWGIVRGKAVFICQNPSFDRGFFAQIVDVYTQEKLNWPYHWLDFASMYWALFVQKAVIEESRLPDEINLSKNTIASLHQLPQENYPHRGMNGVDHLIQCYQKVVGFPEPTS
jgi:DNA polymerase-3 subunit epsilon/oligoribonuclease